MQEPENKPTVHISPSKGGDGDVAAETADAFAKAHRQRHLVNARVRQIKVKNRFRAVTEEQKRWFHQYQQALEAAEQAQSSSSPSVEENRGNKGGKKSGVAAKRSKVDKGTSSVKQKGPVKQKGQQEELGEDEEEFAEEELGGEDEFEELGEDEFSPANPSKLLVTRDDRADHFVPQKSESPSQRIFERRHHM